MRQPRINKVVRFWIILLFLLLSISYIVHLIRNIVTDASTYFQNYAIIQYNQPTNQIYLIYKQAGNLFAWKIPEDTILPLAYGLGQYRLDNIYKLGQLLGKNERLMIDSLSNYYQIPVLSLVITYSKYNLYLSGSIKSSLLDHLWKGRWTDYSGGQGYSRIPFCLWLWRSSAESIKRIESLVFNKNGYDSELLRENFSIEVINTTQTNGLADKFTQHVEANGLRVITVGNNTHTNQFNCLVYPNKRSQNSYTQRWLEYFRGCKIGSLLGDDSKTDIRIEVGDGFGEIIDGK